MYDSTVPCDKCHSNIDKAGGCDTITCCVNGNDGCRGPDCYTDLKGKPMALHGGRCGNRLRIFWSEDPLKRRQMNISHFGSPPALEKLWKESPSDSASVPASTSSSNIRSHFHTPFAMMRSSPAAAPSVTSYYSPPTLLSPGRTIYYIGPALFPPALTNYWGGPAPRQSSNSLSLYTSLEDEMDWSSEGISSLYIMQLELISY